MSAKRDWKDEYWEECVAIGAEECGAVLTKEQVQDIAASVRGGHENYGMASGSDVASSNRRGYLDGELEKARAEVRRERAKVHCRACAGNGRIVTQGPHHSSDSQCWKCDGDGRHDP